jgi:peptidoglycan hydrolase-like protein with peptidoglycan-binding domain
MVKAPEPTKVPTEPVYATVNKQVMVQPERSEWTQVLCDVNATDAKIEEVTRALNDKGASPPLRTTVVDGKVDPELTNAVRSFQQNNGLQPTGLLTAETLAKLGVDLK